MTKYCSLDYFFSHQNMSKPFLDHRLYRNRGLSRYEWRGLAARPPLLAPQRLLLGYGLDADLSNFAGAPCSSRSVEGAGGTLLEKGPRPGHLCCFAFLAPVAPSTAGGSLGGHPVVLCPSCAPRVHGCLTSSQTTPAATTLLWSPMGIAGPQASHQHPT